MERFMAYIISLIIIYSFKIKWVLNALLCKWNCIQWRVFVVLLNFTPLDKYSYLWVITFFSGATIIYYYKMLFRWQLVEPATSLDYMYSFCNFRFRTMITKQTFKNTFEYWIYVRYFVAFYYSLFNIHWLKNIF